MSARDTAQAVAHRSQVDAAIELRVPSFRRFALERTVDETGISGTGIVACGVVFPSGRAVTQWRSTDGVPMGSIAIYDSLEQLIAIHGHGGRTVIRFLDRVEPILLAGAA